MALRPPIDPVGRLLAFSVTILLASLGTIGSIWVGYSVFNRDDLRSLPFGRGALVLIGSLGLLAASFWIGRVTTAIRPAVPHVPNPPRWWSPIAFAAMVPLAAVYAIAEFRTGIWWQTTLYATLAVMMGLVTRATIARYRAEGDPARASGTELFNAFGLPLFFMMQLFIGPNAIVADLRSSGFVASFLTGGAVAVYMHWTRLDTLGPK